MNFVVEQIEKQISQLSLQEQLYLLEKLAHNLRKKITVTEVGNEGTFLDGLRNSFEETNPVLEEHYKTKEYKFHQKALSDFKNMPEKEQLQTLINAGIYNENLELTERYGGTGKPSSTKRLSKD